MSIPSAPNPARLIFGLLVSEEVEPDQVLVALFERFGPVERLYPFAPYVRSPPPQHHSRPP